MDLKIAITDDIDLRNFVKETIKGQITSIARDEIRDSIKDAATAVAEQRMNNYSQAALNNLLIDGIRDLDKTKIFTDAVENRVDKTLEWIVKDLVRNLVKEHVERLVTERAERMLREHIWNMDFKVSSSAKEVNDGSTS